MSARKEAGPGLAGAVPSLIEIYFRAVKQGLRVVALLVLLALVGFGVWCWTGAEGLRSTKDAVKVLLGRKPRLLNGPAAAGTVAVVQGKLATGDEPPFSLASGAWSLTAYEQGGKMIRPNLQFDFERAADEDTARLSRRWAHGGTYSYRMDAGTEYSPAIRRRLRDVAVRLASVDVGFWAWSSGSDVKVTAVVSIDRDGKQVAWFGKDIALSAADAEGSRMNARFLIGDQRLDTTDVVSVYFWKRGKEDAYLDDVDLFFHSSEVPGRRLGTPVALDSIAAGTQPYLVFAPVAVHDVVVDTLRFGAEKEAPPTTMDAIPFGTTGKRWKFVPQEGLAYLLDANDRAVALIRPWSSASGIDIAHFDRVLAEQAGEALLLTGFDVAMRNGRAWVKAQPAPRSVRVELMRE